jgi:hypothetical protein
MDRGIEAPEADQVVEVVDVVRVGSRRTQRQSS